MPIVTAADRLSSEGAEILEALLKITTYSASLADKVKALPAQEIGIVAERLLARARTVNQWGVPAILYGLLTVAQVKGEHVQVIVRFLESIPAKQLTPAIVPLLADKPWADIVLSKWASDSKAKEPVKKAIANASKKGGK